MHLEHRYTLICVPLVIISNDRMTTCPLLMFVLSTIGKPEYKQLLFCICAFLMNLSGALATPDLRGLQWAFLAMSFFFFVIYLGAMLLNFREAYNKSVLSRSHLSGSFHPSLSLSPLSPLPSSVFSPLTQTLEC